MKKIIVISFMVPLALAACWHTTAPKAHQKSLAEVVLGNTTGWILLPQPSSLIKPGAVVIYSEEDGLGYRTRLNVCGLPDNYLVEDQGVFPRKSYSRNVESGLDVSVGAIGIGFGGDINLASSYTVQVSDSGHRALVRQPDIDEWIRDSFVRAAGTACINEIAQEPNVFYVGEVAYIKAGSITFAGADEAKLDLNLDKFRKVVDLGADADLSIDDSGSIRFDQEVAIAIRGSRRIEFEKINKGRFPAATGPLLRIKAVSDSDEDLKRALSR